MLAIPTGPYSVDVGSDSETWDNIFVNADEIEKLIIKNHLIRNDGGFFMSKGGVNDEDLQSLTVN